MVGRKIIKAIRFVLASFVLLIPLLCDAAELDDLLDDASLALNADNHQVAFSLYLESAERNSPEAAFQLSKMYFQGLGTNIDEVKGMFWLVKAIEFDYLPAMYSLAMRTMEIDSNSAMDLMREAASQGHAGAVKYLTSRYNSAVLGTDLVNDRFHASWFNYASEGDVNALKALLSHVEDVDLRDDSGMSALLLAVKNNKPEAVKWLLVRGAHISIDALANRDKVQSSQQSVEYFGKDQGFRRAPNQNSSLQDQGWINSLANSASLDSQVFENVSEGISLRQAVESGQIALLPVLLTNGVSPFTKDDAGHDVLELAIFNNKHEEFNTLYNWLKSNSRLEKDAVDRYFQAAVQFACLQCIAFLRTEIIAR